MTIWAEVEIWITGRRLRPMIYTAEAVGHRVPIKPVFPKLHIDVEMLGLLNRSWVLLGGKRDLLIARKPSALMRAGGRFGGSVRP